MKVPTSISAWLTLAVVVIVVLFAVQKIDFLRELIYGK